MKHFSTYPLWVLFFVMSCRLLQAQPEPEAISPEQFSASAGIVGQLNPGDRVRLELQQWVFDKSRHFPDDIRILDTEGNQWPFFVSINSQQTNVGKSVEIRNLTLLSGEDAYVAFDLIMPVVTGEKEVHDGIQIRTTGERFLRRVEVYADPACTHLLGAGYLVKELHPKELENDVISYPASDLKRLYIRVFSDARTVEDTFEILGASTGFREKPSREEKRMQLRYEELVASQSDLVNGAQTLVLDLGQDQLAPEWILFSVNDPSFVRSVSVSARNEIHDRWTYVSSGTIFRKAGESGLELKLPARRNMGRFLKIDIFHFDDPSLELESVELETRRRVLVFEVRSDAPARLYVGDATLRRANYDLERRLDPAAIEKLPTVKTAESVDEKAVGWGLSFLSKWGSWLSLLVIAIVSIVVIRVVMGMAKNLKDESV